jgi:hypothetical protein
MQPFPPVIRTTKNMLEALYTEAANHVTGELDFVSGDGWKIYIGLVGGSADQIEGTWTVDIDILADSWNDAMDRSLDIEAAIVGPRRRAGTILVDNVYQNETPVDRPWSDEAVSRVGATYTITARRPTASSA